MAPREKPGRGGSGAIFRNTREVPATDFQNDVRQASGCFKYGKAAQIRRVEQDAMELEGDLVSPQMSSRQPGSPAGGPLLTLVSGSSSTLPRASSPRTARSPFLWALDVCRRLLMPVWGPI